MSLSAKLACRIVFLALSISPNCLLAQIRLPEVVVKEPIPAKHLRGSKKPISAKRPVTSVSPLAASRPPPSDISAGTGPIGSFPPAGGGVDPSAIAARKLNEARDRIFTSIGTSVSTISGQEIDALPQGTNQQFDKLLLQTTGVAQDSAASGNFHVRNEHANVQTRVNGVLLPDGVSGFGQFLETGFVGNLSLITGALPAQYGLRTAGLLDIQTRSGAFENGGSISLYGGSRGTITPSFENGGHIGTTDYFFTGRFNTSQIGVENPTPSNNALHDQTRQGKFFGYVSSQIDDATRLTFIAGSSVDRYQIPNTPGLMPSFIAFGQSNFDSSKLNENQTERNFYNVVALQRSVGTVDVQLSAFSRYSTLSFVPDLLGDLLFNGVASSVYRSSFVNGVAADAAHRFNDWNTLRFGVSASAEQTRNVNGSVVLPLDANSNPVDAPFSILDKSSKTGFLISGYLQDEWKITDQLTLNAGARFDQMVQYVDGNQLSPRVSLTYKPFADTSFHIGIARYFTPPQQVLSAPANLDLVNSTTQQPAVGLQSPVKPERSHVFDAGVTQKVLRGLELGVDAYYKRAKDLLDDGQFGQALVLDTFNYARAYNEGVEFKAKYVSGNFSAYANLAIAKQKAKDIVSNQYLFDPDELAYISGHYINTDHAQRITGSGGASYLFDGTRFSADLIYGSGLRSGFANTSHVPAYAQVNLGLSHEFQFSGLKPTILRFDIVNLFDTIYEIRDGSGIGVFAPQYGPRRGFFGGITQQF